MKSVERRYSYTITVIFFPFKESFLLLMIKDHIFL